MEGQVSRRFGEEIKNLSLSGLGFSYLFLKAKESKAADADTPSLLFGNNNKDASLGAAVNTATIVARGVCFPLAGSDGPVLAQDPAPGPSGLTPSPPHCPHPHTTGSPTWAVSTQVQVRVVGTPPPTTSHAGARTRVCACAHAHTCTDILLPGAMSPEVLRRGRGKRECGRRGGEPGGLGLGPRTQGPSGEKGLLAEPGEVGQPWALGASPTGSWLCLWRA